MTGFIIGLSHLYMYVVIYPELFTWPSDIPIGEFSMKSGGANTSAKDTASSFISPQSWSTVFLINLVGAPPDIYPPKQIDLHTVRLLLH